MMTKKPSKSRKAFFSRAKHTAVKALASHLSEKLAKELNRRAVSLRKGDTVRVMRGNHKGKEGKVTSVNVLKGRVYVEKIIAKKSNGEEVSVSIDASKLMIIELDKMDKKRFEKKESEKQ